MLFITPFNGFTGKYIYSTMVKVILLALGPGKIKYTGTFCIASDIFVTTLYIVSR